MLSHGLCSVVLLCLSLFLSVLIECYIHVQCIYIHVVCIYLESY